MTKTKLLGILSIGVILALSAIVYVGFGSVAATSLKPHDSSLSRCIGATVHCHGVGKPDVFICPANEDPDAPTEAFVFFVDSNNNNRHDDNELLNFFPIPCES
jgi:hypothetical protein